MIDKKTIIGLVLIFGVFSLWMYMTQPSEEEKAQMRRKQDSALTEQIKRQDETYKKEKVKAANQSNAKKELETLVSQVKSNDSLSLEAMNKLNNRYGVFSEAALNENKSLSVENGLLKTDFSSLGGMIEQVILKEYKTYSQDSVRFFVKGGNTYGLNLSLGSKVLRTNELNFEIFVNDKPLAEEKNIKVSSGDSVVVSMRLYANPDSTTKDRSYLEYRYTVRDNDYRIGFAIITSNLNKTITDGNALEFVWNAKLRMKEKDRQVENKNTSIQEHLHLLSVAGRGGIPEGKRSGRYKGGKRHSDTMDFVQATVLLDRTDNGKRRQVHIRHDEDPDGKDYKG